MISDTPLPLMTQMVSNNIVPNYGTSTQNYNPTTRLTIEQLQNQLQHYQQPQTIPQNNDPYTEGSTLLSQCSEYVKQHIIQNKDYQQIDAEFEFMIKQVLYASAAQYILGNQQGRIVVEKWCNTIKQLKQDYGDLEAQELQSLMKSKSTIDLLSQDPIIKQRLEELQRQNNQQITEEG